VKTKKQSKKQGSLVSIKVYFITDDKTHMEIYATLQELSKSMGISLSTATGMALRRGVPIVKSDWENLMLSHEK